MQVINISNTIFKASSAAIAANTGGRTHSKANVEEILYNDINAFLDKEIDKNEYINRFKDKVANLNIRKDFSEVEQNYIQELLMTIDSVESNDEIYTGYLRWLIKDILKWQKSEK